MPIDSYGLFKAISNILPCAGVKTVFVVGCGPPSKHHEIDGFLGNYPGAIVYGFEPCPANFAGLSQKFAGTKRVRLFDLALTDFDGMATFHINEPGGTSSLFEWNKQSVHKSASWVTKQDIDVVAYRLDSFCSQNKIDHIDLLFMDVQGAEHLVLLGAIDTILHRGIDVIVGEAIFTDIYGYAHGFHSVYSILASTEWYDFYGLYRPLYNDKGKLCQGDYVFVKRK